MSGAVSAATINRYFALLRVRGSETNISGGVPPSSLSWRSASRKCPASSRSRSRLTSLTEGLAEILSSERKEVEILVPDPRSHLVQEFLVADQQRLSPQRVIA